MQNTKHIREWDDQSLKLRRIIEKCPTKAVCDIVDYLLENNVRVIDEDIDAPTEDKLELKCSQCGGTVGYGKKLGNFCPNCGIKQL